MGRDPDGRFHRTELPVKPLRRLDLSTVISGPRGRKGGGGEGADDAGRGVLVCANI